LVVFSDLLTICIGVDLLLSAIFGFLAYCFSLSIPFILLLLFAGQIDASVSPQLPRSLSFFPLAMLMTGLLISYRESFIIFHVSIK